MSSNPTHWRLSVPGGLDAPARARHALSDELNGQLSRRRTADVCLLLHELVANSVLHADADVTRTIDLWMTVSEGAVRVEVSDAGSTSVPSLRATDTGRGGHGLRLVEALSDSWGMRREGSRGTSVWFELRREAPGGM
jgi:anti-sigma regulatory factor (Ser/Thr protein kinase)